MHSMIYFNPLRNEADFSFWKNKKENKKTAHLLGRAMCRLSIFLCGNRVSAIVIFYIYYT